MQEEIKKPKWTREQIESGEITPSVDKRDGRINFTQVESPSASELAALSIEYVDSVTGEVKIAPLATAMVSDDTEVDFFSKEAASALEESKRGYDDANDIYNAEKYDYPATGWEAPAYNEMVYNFSREMIALEVQDGNLIPATPIRVEGLMIIHNGVVNTVKGGATLGVDGQQYWSLIQLEAEIEENDVCFAFGFAGPSSKDLQSLKKIASELKEYNAEEDGTLDQDHADFISGGEEAQSQHEKANNANDDEIKALETDFNARTAQFKKAADDVKAATSLNEILAAKKQGNDALTEYGTAQPRIADLKSNKDARQDGIKQLTEVMLKADNLRDVTRKAVNDIIAGYDEDIKTLSEFYGGGNAS